MAFKRRGKRYGRKRYRRKPYRKRLFRRRRGRGRASVGKQASVLKDATIVKLTYHTYINSNVNNILGTYSYFFRGNGPYDPDVSGVGGQPSGYDQWATLYQRYKVLGSSISVTGRLDSDAGGNELVLLSIAPQLDTTTTSWDDMASNPYSKLRVVPNVYAGYPMKIKSYMTTPKIWGIGKKSEFSDVAYSADYNQNPTNQWYWHVFFSTYDGAPASGTQNFTSIVRLTYYVKWYKRRVFTDV